MSGNGPVAGSPSCTAGPLRGVVAGLVLVLVGAPGLTLGLAIRAAAASRAGEVTVFRGLPDSFALTTGPDGALWFTSINSIGRLTTGGHLRVFSGPGISVPRGIAVGPDGALWFANNGDSTIGRITTAGMVTNYTDPRITSPLSIAAGRDGAMWFTNLASWNGTAFVNSAIGRITMAGAITMFTGPSINDPVRIASGADGALWFTNQFDSAQGSIGRITTGGTVTTYTDPSISGRWPLWLDPMAPCGSPTTSTFR